MFVAEGLKPDLNNEGWVKGWGVVSNDPWNLVGVYATKDVAETKCSQLSGDYLVRYGSHRIGSDDFVWSETS